jgi:hypothetical protein
MGFFRSLKMVAFVSGGVFIRRRLQMSVQNMCYVSKGDYHNHDKLRFPECVELLLLILYGVSNIVYYS